MMCRTNLMNCAISWINTCTVQAASPMKTTPIAARSMIPYAKHLTYYETRIWKTDNQELP